MNRRQEDKLSMYYAVIAACDKHNAAWAGLAAFATGYTAFQGHVATIAAASGDQQAGTIGHARQKTQARAAMAAAATPLAGALQAWAAVESQPAVAAKIDFAPSDLLYGRDTLAEDRARLIHGEATTRLAALATYGVTQPLLDTLGDAIDAYHAQIVAPRTAIIDRKAATSTLAAAFDAADRVLVDRLDKLIPLLALTQAAFATDYRNSRIIVDSGGRGGAEEDEESSSSSFPSSIAA